MLVKTSPALRATPATLSVGLQDFQIPKVSVKSDHANGRLVDVSFPRAVADELATVSGG